jgi:dCTP deaminase
MILSDASIREEIKKGNLIIDPFDEQFLQPSSYDVMLAPQFRTFQNHKISFVDVRKRRDITDLVDVGEDGEFMIHPGQFVLGNTVERFSIPKHLAGKLEGRSSLGRLGLIIHATAGYVDPGFSGQLTFEISNISGLPIKLYSGMRVAQICFFRMTGDVLRPYGKAGNKYQGQTGPTASRVWKDFK